MSKVECIVETRDLVGESPFWHAAEQQLFWVDIVGRAIRRRDADGSVSTWPTEDVPTAIALIEDDADAVVSFGKGLARFSFATGKVTPLCSPEGDDVTMRLNEGKCDPSGRFWAASMDNNLNPDGSARQQTGARGRLLRLDADGGFAQFGDADLGIPNTMAWSPDRSTFYFGDTLRNVIWAYDYDDVEGRVSNRRVLIEGGPGMPDGSGIDSEGCLWNARFSAGRVLRITPQGRIDREIELPCQNPTACTFGGPDRATLFVTSGRFGLPEAEVAANPLHGGLFAVDVGIEGLPDNYFRSR
jgi:sugar lactone lactonase YvrE